MNVNTLATQGLGVTIPRQLIEKWAGENPGDLVAVVGERPFQKLLPNGLTVGVGGSTVSPRPDVSAFVNDQLPQILRTAARDAAENAIRRGLGDRLGDLLPKR